MKHIRVTVTHDYLLPDDWEILRPPQQDLFGLRDDHRHFIPDIHWLERGLAVDPVPGTTWTSVGDERANWFIDHLESVGAEIFELE
jgi:hypothetical protein